MDKALTWSRREIFSAVGLQIDLVDRTPALQVTGSSGPETSISKIDRRLYFDAFRPFTTQGVEHRGLVRKTWRNGLRWLAYVGCYARSGWSWFLQGAGSAILTYILS